MVASAVVLTALTSVVTPAAAGEEERTDVVLKWYDTTAATIKAAGAPTQVTDSRTWAISWLAAARASRDVPRGVNRRDYQDAAVAGAVHRSLSALVPARSKKLDAALRDTLARIPDGPAEERGVAAGEREADVVLTSRKGDGLDPASVNAPFPAPPAEPGVWQPTPPEYGEAEQAGMVNARPFLLERANQFRLSPPPTLGSRRYRTDLAEVHTYGAAGSTVRTPQQTETAAFWYGSLLTLYTKPLRVAVDRSTNTPAARAKLVALFHVALVDTQIAITDSKFTYLRWRPVTAIRFADIDGDPTTAADPTWTPLHTTPPNPDYPSGHSTYASAAEQVLTALVGSSTSPFTLTSPTAPGVTRTYTNWHQLTRENVDARVWSGIHTRSADEAGVTLGRDVAEYTLGHAHRLFE
jgi:hypothetical protein